MSTRHRTRARAATPSRVEPLEGRTLMTATPTLVGPALDPTPDTQAAEFPAMAADGSYTLGIIDDAFQGDLLAQRYTAGGSAVGSPFLIDSNYDTAVDLVCDGPGDLAVLDDSFGTVYLSVVQAGKTTAQSYPLSGDGTARAVSVAVNAAGQGVAVWLEPDADGSDALTARPFTLHKSGTAVTLGTTFATDEYTEGDRYQSAAAVAPDGTIGIMTSVYGGGLIFRTYTSAGKTNGDQTVVSAGGGDQLLDQEPPSLTVDAHGIFTAAVVGPGSGDTPDDQFGLQAQQFTSTGKTLGPVVSYYTTFGGQLLATREGVLTFSPDHFLDVDTTPALIDYDLAFTHPSSVRRFGDYQGYAGDLATNGTGSAIFLYNGLLQRLSIPAPAQAPYKGSAFSVGQTIEAENYDAGGDGTAYHDLDANNVGGQYRLDSGVDVQPGTSASNGYYVGYGMAGEYTEYTVNVATAGTYDIAFSVRGPGTSVAGVAATGGQFHAEVDGVKKADTLTINSSATTFNTVTAKGVALTAGTHVVRVAIDKNATGSGAALNFDSFKITASSATTPTPTPTPVKLAATTFGTAGSYQNAGNTIAKATDGNLSTYFDAPAASGGAVGLDLSSAKTVTQIKFAPRAGYAARMVGGVFQASNSSTFASGVVTVYTVSSAPASGSLTTVTPSTATAYRYWRYVGPAGSYCDVAEVQLFGAGSATGALAATTYGTAGSYQNDGNTAAKATDGNLSTYFDAPTASGGFVGLDLGSAKVVKQLKFAPRAGQGSRMVGGVFQASNDRNFASGVTTVYTVASAPASGSLTAVTLSTTTAYRYWRYVGPANSYCNVAEFQLFGS